MQGRHGPPCTYGPRPARALVLTSGGTGTPSAPSVPWSASYEATLADTSGKPSYDYSSSAGVGDRALVLRRGDEATFHVYAPRDGYRD
ncbi:hypothetical protein [Streptomyces poonensis]|uniref:hypothetical protein n=1 Tax=Streptomyces poonensis TaxID=68255 RepID=UPI00167A53CD|nr:hypothetical protein [Streptomyces poonensis]